MIHNRFAMAAVLSLAVSLAHATGFQRVEVPASGSLPPLRGAVWYPCARPTSDLKLGPFDLSVAKDCPVTGGKLPLVVVSHGRAGSYLGHRDTAEALANAGFVVVAIDHPGDNTMDSSRTHDPTVFVERPADIKRVIDYMLGSWPAAQRIDPGRVGVFGFSRGGYTVLAVIGAELSRTRLQALCEGDESPICDQVRKGALPSLAHDPRVKAAVIADPLGVLFAPESFRDVQTPVQLWASERGGDGVAPENVAAIAEWLPAKPDFHSVPNSQHFAFLAPCPADLMKSAPEICVDKSDFDRAAFHKEFNGAVVAFFRAHLMEAQTR